MAIPFLSRERLNNEVNFKKAEAHVAASLREGADLRLRVAVNCGRQIVAERVKSHVAEPPRPQAPRPGSRTRIEALDMTKGVLVVAMVIYHSFNYSTDYTLGFKCLPFLPPSFILITGFLISRLYFTPETPRDSRVYGRLLFRG